ncbi:MAG: hypothetical protein IT210_08850 [Armatimonadetes bacterium]|nr:hypothetical protein [Armatimonadota bacterium]
MAGAAGPSGYQTYILRLEASQVAAQAKVTFTHNMTRLSRAWLLEPERPGASRLCHLADGKIFAFEIPAASSGAVLVMETTPWRYVPPEESLESPFRPPRASARPFRGPGDLRRGGRAAKLAK